MRVVVVGSASRGTKRLAVAGADAVGDRRSRRARADYRDIEDVPLDRYDAALLCTPDEPKLELLSYLLGNGKHVLVEKPLWAQCDRPRSSCEALAGAPARSATPPTTIASSRTTSACTS